MTMPGTRDEWGRWLAARAGDFTVCVLFCTRLRFARAAPVGGADLAAALWALPLAGVVVGVIAAVVYALARELGLPAWPAAALTIAATAALTGCLHEDGLADTCDGFSGATPARKLEIMRDSHIGVYGACALALALLLRVGAVASLADGSLVAGALIAAHTAARATLPVFMHFVPPARADGLSSAAGQPPREQALAAAVLGIVVLVLGLGFAPALAAVIVLVVVAVLTALLSWQQIGGQ